MLILLKTRELFSRLDYSQRKKKTMIASYLKMSQGFLINNMNILLKIKSIIFLKNVYQLQMKKHPNQSEHRQSRGIAVINHLLCIRAWKTLWLVVILIIRTNYGCLQLAIAVWWTIMVIYIGVIIKIIWTMQQWVF